MIYLPLKESDLELILLALNQYEPVNATENGDLDELIERLEKINEVKNVDQ